MDGKIDCVELDGYGKLLDQVMWLKKNLWGICLFSFHFSDFFFCGGVANLSLEFKQILVISGTDSIQI